jgi:transitional endoplasmic reticulum ATPase
VATRVRAFESGDLGQIIELWDQSGALPADGLTIEQGVDLMRSDTAVALVAEEEDGEVVGTAVGSASGALAHVYQVVAPREEVADQLLDELELRLAGSGARTLTSVVRDKSDTRTWLERRGYRPNEGSIELGRELSRRAAGPAALAEIGGRMISPGLWDDLRGLEDAKQIIERRVILPLAEPQLASRHGVVPPKAIVLFGPPGTGKTTFAKGIASRLSWPFVEIEPAELGGEGPERQAKLLADTFARILKLPSAVAFVDEVEDLASSRHEQRRVSPSVTNEFLRQIPRIREASQHLLACATNSVRMLDPAFLRPGRFDYILPVGPPDAEARAAIWTRYVAEITDEEVDVAALVEATDQFTPADIEFAARKAAQHAFEREHFEGTPHRATTAFFLAAISETRPTLSDEMIESFEEDVRRFARD